MYFEVFRGIHNQWYWRLISTNEQKIAFSSIGYPTKKDILIGIEQIKKVTRSTSVVELKS
ncbi:YegP family protein [Bartonella bacilliformis]|uniref:DUF1508 domain-containing protein n=1 Tax=Bartonella bacilliformis Ver097 TaxID=1293911 RepID=A0A072R0U4_BARBA|nr:DUF1508 domain-containing protein [Bartonella bacilliformis]KEG19236.1 hypothetical protein H710_01015 [Bartonella bacilliformis Ver097]